MSKPAIYKLVPHEHEYDPDRKDLWVMECCGGEWPSCCHHRAYTSQAIAMDEAWAHLRCEHREAGFREAATE